MYGWLVFGTIKIYIYIAYVGLIHVCTLDYLTSKPPGKGGRTKGITIGTILRLARGSVEN